MLIRVTEPILSAGGYLAGCRLTPSMDPVLTEALRLHVLGFKSRTILKGAKLWPGVGKLGKEVGMPEGELRRRLAVWDLQHPEFMEWRDSVHKRARKERFVTNPYGRRVHHLTAVHAQAFMVLSTAQDCLRAAVSAFPDRQVEWISFGSARLAGPLGDAVSPPSALPLVIGG